MKLRMDETKEPGAARGKGGAPIGNENRLKHGRYAVAFLARRKLYAELGRRARAGLALVKRLRAGERPPGYVPDGDSNDG